MIPKINSLIIKDSYILISREARTYKIINLVMQYANYLVKYIVLQVIKMAVSFPYLLWPYFKTCQLLIKPNVFILFYKFKNNFKLLPLIQNISLISSKRRRNFKLCFFFMSQYKKQNKQKNITSLAIFGRKKFIQLYVQIFYFRTDLSFLSPQTAQMKYNYYLWGTLPVKYCY